ncbi:MAG: ATP-binding protein [Oligoflexia bacterium]|nr:ATP-binding protein [Oligoflexia bacterium]
MPRNFPKRIFSRFVLLQAILVLAVLAASGFAARRFFERQFVIQAEAQLRDTLVALSNFLPEGVPGWCGQAARGTSVRFTLIGSDGRVLCDSHHDAETMDNHRDRPEVSAAAREGFGKALRFSHTLNQEMIYGALALGGREEVLRGAMPLSVLSSTLRVLDVALALSLLAIAAALLVFGAWAGRELVAPMGGLLSKMQETLASAGGGVPLAAPKGPAGEWSQLESSLEAIRRDLEAKVEALVTERERQATLIESISDAILAIDRKGVPLFSNSRIVPLLRGFELGNGTNLWEFFREPEILAAFRAGLNGKTGSGPAFAMSLPEGTRYFSLAVAPLRKSHTGIYGAVGVFHDVTELKLAERTRIEFVANASHELRTPLTAIKGYADTLAEDQEAGRPADRGFVDAIRRNADRLMSLVADLLDLSLLESGPLLQKSELDTREESLKVIQQLQAELDRKGQRVAVAAEAPSVFGDPRRLEQVLVNLLDNARKYSPEGSTIRVAWEPGPGASVQLKVSDSGPGIPPEHQARVFERFYRVDDARSRKLGGTGLGLAIVKHILLAHEGSVWVESVTGGGTTFVCEFPGR